MSWRLSLCLKYILVLFGKKLYSKSFFPKASWAEADSNKPERLLCSSAPVHEQEDHQRSVARSKLQAANQQFSLGRLASWPRWFSGYARVMLRLKLLEVCGT